MSELVVHVAREGLRCSVYLDGEHMKNAYAATIQLNAGDFTKVAVSRWKYGAERSVLGQSLEAVQLDPWGKPISESVTFSAKDYDIRVVQVEDVPPAAYDPGEVDPELLIKVDKGIGS